MEDISWTCPLCCGKSFDSRHALADHLENYTENLRCYKCQQKFSNIQNLADHLHGQCDPSDTQISITKNLLAEKIFSECKQDIVLINQTHISKNSNDDPSNNFNTLSIQSEHITDMDSQDNMQIEVQQQISAGSMQILKERLQRVDNIVSDFETAELKLVEHSGEGRYILLGHDGNPALLSDSNVITKQNSDGTISLVPIKNETKQVNEQVKTESEKESENESPSEVYSCNTCGVTFTSVLDHIQMYHNDQEVVLEVNSPSDTMEDADDSQTITLQFPSGEDGGMNDSQDGLQQVTGDINNDTDILDESKDPSAAKKDLPQTLLEEEVVDKIGQVYTRRVVQIDKFWNSVKTSIKTEDNVENVNNIVASICDQPMRKRTRLADGTLSAEMYKCLKCDLQTDTFKEFDMHTCHLLKYTCPHCPVAYNNSKSLCAHMKVHKSKQVTIKSAMQAAVKSAAAASASPPIGPFRCDVCFTIFPTNKSLRLHRRMHDPVKARPIQPPVDNDAVDGIGSTEMYHCTQCDKWIPVGYKTVHQNFHKTTVQHNCDICNRKFPSADYLAMHMKVHTTDKNIVNKQEKKLPYTCLYCSRQFARPHEKVKHERIHTGEKPHSCEICGKSFRVSYCLTLHMRTHTGMRPYACQHCGKRFKAHSVYNHHLLTHSDVRAYKCPFCPKAFKTSVQLAGHKNSHTKPFSCPQCNRPFASLYAVRVHTETHRRQNNLKFSCSLCGASYARTFALKDHVRQAHKRETDAEENPLTTVETDWQEEAVPAIIKEMSSEINELAINSNVTELKEMVIG